MGNGSYYYHLKTKINSSLLTHICHVAPGIHGNRHHKTNIYQAMSESHTHTQNNGNYNLWNDNSLGELEDIKDELLHLDAIRFIWFGGLSLWGDEGDLLLGYVVLHACLVVTEGRRWV